MFVSSDLLRNVASFFPVACQRDNVCVHVFSYCSLQLDVAGIVVGMRRSIGVPQGIREWNDGGQCCRHL